MDKPFWAVVSKSGDWGSKRLESDFNIFFYLALSKKNLFFKEIKQLFKISYVEL